MINEMANLNLSFLIELLKDGKNVEQEFNKLNEFLVAKKCTWYGKAMPTLMKPNFISPKQTTMLQQVVNTISSILNKFINYYIQNEAVRRIMDFSDEENELFFIEPRYSIPLVISRLDAFMQDYNIKFLEFNCDSPAGTAYSDVLEAGFVEFLNRYEVFNDWKIKYFNRQERLLDSLLHCYKDFFGKPKLIKNPTIAIVDWDDVATSSEFELLKEYFEDRGYPTIITSPQRLKIQDGALMSDGKAIDIIYRRVITRELVQRLAEAKDFIRAVKEGFVCMANPFRSVIVGNKKILALLTDPKFQSIYTREELEVIRNTIPWTKILSDQKVEFNKFTVDLRYFVYDNQEKLVLKPASSYGGKDVYLGRETDERTWRQVVDENLESESWVVQQYVPIPEDVFPEITEDGINLKLKKVNINPFAIGAKYSGTISRISDKSVINVSAGGGLIPTMTVAEK